MEQRAIQPQLQPELVEVHVARVLDCLRKREMSVAGRTPASEVAVEVLIPTRALDRHFRVEFNDAALQSHQRYDELPRRGWRVDSLNRPIQ